MRAIRLVLTLAILGLLIRLIGWRELIDVMARTNWPWLVPMYAATGAGLLANAALARRWLMRGGLSVGLRRVVLANTLSTFYTLVLPSDLLAGLAKWADLSAATGDKARVLSALILAKLSLALPPLLLGTTVLFVNSPFGDTALIWFAAGASAVALALALAGMIALLQPALGAVTDRWLMRGSRMTPGVIRSRLLTLAASLERFRDGGSRDYVAVAALALAAFAAGIVGFWCATRAAGADAPLSSLVWLSMVLFIARLVPITFSNLGVRESLLALGLGLYAVPPAVAVTVGLLLFSNTIVLAVIGALYQIAVVRGWLKWRLDTSAASSTVRPGESVD